MHRRTSLVVQQRPGRMLLRVTVIQTDGKVLASHSWTWLGKLLRYFTRGKWPVAKVTVTRTRDFALRTRS